jgi:hypothetical protein
MIDYSSREIWTKKCEHHTHTPYIMTILWHIVVVVVVLGPAIMFVRHRNLSTHPLQNLWSRNCVRCGLAFALKPEAQLLPPRQFPKSRTDQSSNRHQIQNATAMIERRRRRRQGAIVLLPLLLLVGGGDVAVVVEGKKNPDCIPPTTGNKKQRRRIEGPSNHGLRRIESTSSQPSPPSPSSSAANAVILSNQSRMDFSSIRASLCRRLLPSTRQRQLLVSKTTDDRNLVVAAAASKTTTKVQSSTTTTTTIHKYNATESRILVYIRLLFLCYYASLGALMPYLPVYYESIGHGGKIIGLLGAVKPAT